MGKWVENKHVFERKMTACVAAAPPAMGKLYSSAECAMRTIPLLEPGKTRPDRVKE